MLGGSPGFEVFKNTQKQYMVNPFVLIAALRDRAIDNSSVFDGEPAHEEWLAKNLMVDFPGNGEIMTVSLKGNDAKEIAAVVNAVVDAYMKEVASKEQKTRQSRLLQLETIRLEKGGPTPSQAKPPGGDGQSGGQRGAGNP